MVQSGLKSFNSLSVGRINIFLKKCAIQATSLTSRTDNRVSGLAPQKPSMTYSFFPVNCLTEILLRCSQASLERRLLSDPELWPSAHQTLSLVVSSSTMY